MSRCCAPRHRSSRAIDRTQAMIEFDLDGKVLRANENFLHAFGYSLRRGQGPASFDVRRSGSYRESSGLPAVLGKAGGRGEYDAGQYKRIGKGGKRSRGSRPATTRSSTRPASPSRWSKYATDITDGDDAQRQLQRPDRRHQQGAGGDRVRPGRQGAAPPTRISSAALGYTLDGNPRAASQHVRRSGLPAEQRIPAVLGQARRAANTMPGSTSGSARAAGRSGSRPATTRSSDRTASRSRW